MRAAADAACSARFDAVIAAGGDGTIHDVASGLLGSAIPLGIIPMGTANVFAREIGLPSSPDHIAMTLLNGKGARSAKQDDLAQRVPISSRVASCKIRQAQAIQPSCLAFSFAAAQASALNSERVTRAAGSSGPSSEHTSQGASPLR
jgi:hypothetical protein